mgnify:CR=1 FL=1
MKISDSLQNPMKNIFFLNHKRRRRRLQGGEVADLRFWRLHFKFQISDFEFSILNFQFLISTLQVRFRISDFYFSTCLYIVVTTGSSVIEQGCISFALTVPHKNIWVTSFNFKFNAPAE